MPKYISSLQNTTIKEILALKEKSKARKKAGLFVIEGLREIGLAIQGNYDIQTILFYSSIISKEKIENNLSLLNVDFIEVSKEVYEKLAYRSSTEGIIALAKTKDFSLDNITFKSSNPLILVAEAPEKPGNIGALLRTADAANVDAVLIANPKTDMYNQNIIRSSVGCIFTNTIAVGTSDKIIAFLKQHAIHIYGTALSASVNYHTIDYKKPTAIVVGTEANGLTANWLKNTTNNIIIPMQGKIDSMNVSVAAAIVLFEAKRQRNFT